MVFIRRLYPDGGEYLGTLDFIKLDGRKTRDNQIADADYHMHARRWAGYNMYSCRALRDDWTLVHKGHNEELRS
jgi:hypothetical protein